MPDLAVSRNLFNFTRVLHERHELFHKIEFIEHKDKLLNWNFQFCIHQHCHCLIEMLGKYFVERSIFLMDPAFWAQNSLVLPDILDLLLDILDQFFVFGINLSSFFLQKLQVGFSVLESLINPMPTVSFDHFLKNLLNAIVGRFLNGCPFMLRIGRKRFQVIKGVSASLRNFKMFESEFTLILHLTFRSHLQVNFHFTV